ncbi:MAG: MATE family efflux transporter [Myxococcales bacterium]|nr:MATE family efflux transporter [Myxococcales bacterium]
MSGLQVASREGAGRLSLARIGISAGLARDIGDEAKASYRLAWPLVLSFMGHNLLGLVDTAMVGRLGASELAGVAIGNGLYFTVSVLGMGLVNSLDPVVSQAVGAGEGARAQAALKTGIKLALGAALLVVVLASLSPLILPLFGISEEIAKHAREFTWARTPGTIPFVIAMAFRSYLQARGATRALMWGAFAANVVNIILNYLLIFGHEGLGIPKLGVIGSGVASSVATLAQLGVLIYIAKRLPTLEGGGDTHISLRKLIGIGLPISVTLVAEVGAFAIAGLLAGRIGPEAGSGHQVAIQLASFTFMVSMAISNATSVRVGNAVGRGDSHGVRLSGWVGLGLSAAYMTLTALGFLLFAESLAWILSDRPEIIAVAVPLVHIAAAFQLFDGAQVVAAGALRGLGDTKSAQHANLIGYYALGLPVAVVLGFYAGWKEQGLWWGLCLGLGFVAVFLVRRFAKLSRGTIART